MGRKYAGILGGLAFNVLLARGMLAGQFEPSLIWQACGGLFVFAAIGAVAGMLANQFITESVRTRFAAEWQEQTTSAPSKSKGKAA